MQLTVSLKRVIIADMERYFDEVIQAEYIGYDEAHYALVSAAVIDSVINSFDYEKLSEYCMKYWMGK